MRLAVKGHATFVATAGPDPRAAREAVVLIHGAGMAASIWAGQLQALASADRAVLAPTLPGHGRPGTSQASEGALPPNIETHADWIADLLDASGLERAVLVGHSMGSLIAVETARRHPERVAAMGLVATALRMRVHPALLEAARATPARAAAQILAWGFGARQAERPPALALVNVGRQMLLASAAGVLATDLAACDAWTAGDLSAIACPTLVLVADGDRMTPPKAGRAMAAALPSARVVEVPGAGHMTMVERPRAVTAVLRAWLSDVASGGTGGER